MTTIADKLRQFRLHDLPKIVAGGAAAPNSAKCRECGGPAMRTWGRNLNTMVTMAKACGHGLQWENADGQPCVMLLGVGEAGQSAAARDIDAVCARLELLNDHRAIEAKDEQRRSPHGNYVNDPARREKYRASRRNRVRNAE